PALLQQACGLELRCHIRKTGSQRISPTLDTVRLYCTPVANLCSHAAAPIRRAGRQDYYLLRPAPYPPPQCAVSSVDRLTGSERGGMRHTEYVAFESFEHDNRTEGAVSAPHYSLRQYPSLHGEGLETFLSFGGGSEDLHETLSIELTCTNHRLPSQLGIGD